MYFEVTNRTIPEMETYLPEDERGRNFSGKRVTELGSGVMLKLADHVLEQGGAINCVDATAGMVRSEDNFRFHNSSYPFLTHPDLPNRNFVVITFGRGLAYSEPRELYYHFLDKSRDKKATGMQRLDDSWKLHEERIAKIDSLQTNPDFKMHTSYFGLASLQRLEPEQNLIYDIYGIGFYCFRHGSEKAANYINTLSGLLAPHGRICSSVYLAAIARQAKAILNDTPGIVADVYNFDDPVLKGISAQRQD